MAIADADLKNALHGLSASRVWLPLSKVRDFLVERNVEAYVVGGLVRDVLLGRDTADIDFAVASDALEVASSVAAALGGKYVLLDRLNRLARVVLADEEAPSARAQWQLDFSTFEDGVQRDLARRDFAIDAMAIDLRQLGKDFSDVQVIDPFGGQDDLRQRVLRAVAETTFETDAARLLRAVRLAAELGFTVDNRTERLMRRHANLIAGVAGERVREELLRLLAVSGSGQYLTYLDELGLLTAVLPELAGTKGVEQPKEHCWDVFEHSVRVVMAVDFVLRDGGWEYGGDDVLTAVPWSARLAEHFDGEVSSGSTRRSLLKLAALLHDVAKPQTKAIDAGGRTRFLGHAREGAALAANMLERLRFSAKEVRLVETAVRHHLRPGQMSQDKLPTPRAVYRYFRDCGAAGIDILFLSLADHLATRGWQLDLSHWQRHVRVVECALGRYFEQQNIVRPPKLVDGHDLIDIFGVTPGPRIGEILEAVREAQASGELASREEALAYVRESLLTRAERQKHG